MTTPHVRGPLSAWWWRHQRALTPPLLLAPAVLMFALFVLYPITQSIYLSFFDWHGIGPKRWVGLENYYDLLADPVAQTAIVNNFIWLLIYGAAPVFGLLFAIFLNQALRGIRLMRALFMIPFVISQVVVGLIFTWFLNPYFGLFNHILAWIGVSPVDVLGDEDWAIVAVACAGLWPQTAYCMILYLTALTGLRQDQIDAARIDGARGFRLLWDVVLPQLRPVTFIAVLVCIIGALRSFDLVSVITAGGPYNSSTVLAYYMYEQTFQSLRYGYGAAIATALFLLMLACVSVFLWRMLRREAR